MSEQRKVWAASVGSYSDYRVRAVFEREEDATAYVADGWAEYVEEFDFHPAGYRAKTTVLWKAQRWRRGSWWSQMYGDDVHVTEEPRLDDDEGVAQEYRRPKVTADEVLRSPGEWFVEVLCTDREAAIKACADRAFVHDARDARIRS